MSEKETLESIYNLLAENKIVHAEEDLYIQFPNSTEEMQIPAGGSSTLSRRINKRLKTITVSIPENGTMEILNNNITRFFFSDESGTLEFPNGVYLEDMDIILTNTGTTPARFNYRMIFTA